MLAITVMNNTEYFIKLIPSPRCGGKIMPPNIGYPEQRSLNYLVKELLIGFAIAPPEEPQQLFEMNLPF